MDESYSIPILIILLETKIYKQNYPLKFKARYHIYQEQPYEQGLEEFIANISSTKKILKNFRMKRKNDRQ